MTRDQAIHCGSKTYRGHPCRKCHDGEGGVPHYRFVAPTCRLPMAVRR